MAKRIKSQNSSLAALKYTVIIVFVLSAVTFISLRTGEIVRRAELFRVKEIVKSPSLQYIRSAQLDAVIGRSIFDVNLAAIQRYLRSQYPEIERLRVVRSFPNRIYVAAQKREPMAVLALGKGEFLVDRKGVVLAVDSADSHKLPAISGLQDAVQAQLGRPLRRDDVDTALEIIESVQQNEYLKPYSIVAINVGNLSKIDCRFSEEINVILDRDKINEKVKTLGLLLSQSDIDFKQIEYIDLRFKEPVLGRKKG